MTEHDAAIDRDPYFPRGRELAAIGAFWLLFALLSLSNWFFAFSRDRRPLDATDLAGGALTALIWAIVTPCVFWLARRMGEEGVKPLARVVAFVAAGILVALLVEGVVDALRGTMFAQPQFRGGGGRPRGRPMWALERGRFLSEFTIYAAILSAGIARDFFLRYQRRLRETATLRTQLTEARLTALQSQLNPHFLFNTLNAVAALVDRDPAGVRRMIARLSELLRATLDPNTDPEVPLATEIGFATRYLEILQIRFEGRLQTTIDASPELGSALVPRLVFQPLIENAMKHAVSQTSAPSRIAIAARRDGYDLVLSVSDTGPGEPGSASTTGETATGTGIGLQNTRARLAQLYGDEAQLVLEPNAEKGTTVTIRIPYHVARPGRPEAAT